MSSNSRVRGNAPIIIAIVLVGLNLRPSMAAIGPLLEGIRLDINLTYTQISLLTMLPILAMGIAMFRGARLAARWGEHRVIASSLLIVGLASLARKYANSNLDLALTATVAGAGIAIIQSVMPSLIKSRFPNAMALFMGIYVTSIMGGAALSASTASFISTWLGGWQQALAFWAALAAVSLAAWYLIRTDINSTILQCAPQCPLEYFTKRPRAWLLGIFFGLGTASYTCVLAWLPPFFVDQGWQSSQSGFMLAFLTSVEVVSGLVMPALANRSKDRRPVLFFVLFTVIFGFVGLLIAPTYHPLIWCGLLGLGIGGLFPMSLIVAMDHMDTPQRAGQLTAFVQGIGYLIAAFSPLLAGYLKDTYSSFDLAWVMLIAASVAMLVIASRFRPTDYRRHFRSGHAIKGLTTQPANASDS